MTVLRVIDVETTGMEPPEAVVIELGFSDLQLVDGQWTVLPPVSTLFGAASIPPEPRAVHHISKAEIAGLPAFDAAAMVMGCIGVSAIVAHNYAFEAQFIGDHSLPTICTLKAALRVWPDAPAHSNGVLRYWLEDQGKLSLDHATAMPPHRAGPDAYVTAHILKALFEAGATGKDMVAWTREPRLLPTCPIGKFRGQKWADVEAGFLTWMTNQPTMEADLKWNAQREIDRRRA